MGKNKGGEGSGTSKSVAQRRKQQELARAARQTRKKEKKYGRFQDVPKPIDMTMIPLKIVCRNRRYDEANAAFYALMNSETLQIYVPRFKHRDNWQRAVMAGFIELELPFEIARRVESELAPHWQRERIAKADENSTEVSE